MAKKATTPEDGIDPREVERRLAEPFGSLDVQWTVGAHLGSKAALRPTVSASVVADRLDEVLGVAGWQDRYEVVGSGVLCYIKAKVGKAAVEKSDGVMGLLGIDVLSESFKRAAAKFGVGRYLAAVPAQWVEWDAANQCAKSQPALPKRFLCKREQDKVDQRGADEVAPPIVEAALPPVAQEASPGINGQKVPPVQLGEGGGKPAPSPAQAPREARPDHTEMYQALAPDDKKAAKPLADAICTQSGPEGSRAALLAARNMFRQRKALTAPVVAFLEALVSASWDGTPGNEVLQ
jgi:hypothetical protein